MNDEEWDMHINKWRTQILNKKNRVDKLTISMVERLTAVGESNPDAREKIANSIREMLRPFKGYNYRWSKIPDDYYGVMK